MPETIAQYRERTRFMGSALPSAPLDTRAVADKVDDSGAFRSCYGDAAIFALPTEMVCWLLPLQDQLYAALGPCLAERIPSAGLRLTLHNFHFRTDRMPDGMEDTCIRAQEAILELRSMYPQTLALRSVGLFAAGGSVMLGLEPVRDFDCAALEAMYGRLEQIVPLRRPFTLYVTLACFRPGVYEGETLARIRETLGSIGRDGREWRIDPMELQYAVFQRMDCFETIADDPFQLSRFLRAQQGEYLTALREIRLGRKVGHWMWFIFPQMKGLGNSSHAYYYGLSGIDEARAYLAHPVLGPRLVEITQALLPLPGDNPERVMSHPDHLKLLSCMTLFNQVEGADPAFATVMDKYYHGRRDAKTLGMLADQHKGETR